MKTEAQNSTLAYSEYFCQISSKSLLVILSYTVLKLRRFWDTVYFKNINAGDNLKAKSQQKYGLGLQQAWHQKNGPGLQFPCINKC